MYTDSCSMNKLMVFQTKFYNQFACNNTSMKKKDTCCIEFFLKFNKPIDCLAIEKIYAENQEFLQGYKRYEVEV